MPEKTASRIAGEILARRELRLAFSADHSAGGAGLPGAWKPDLEPRWPKGTPGVDHAGHPLGGEFMQVGDILSTIDKSISKSQNLSWLAKGSTRIKSISAVREGENLRMDITLKDGRSGTLTAVPDAPFAKVMARLVQVDSGQRVVDQPHSAEPHTPERVSPAPDLTVPPDVSPVNLNDLPIPQIALATVARYQNDPRNKWPPDKGSKADDILGPFQHTLEMWTNSDGAFDPKRKKLHDKIIADLLDPFDGGETEPTVMFTAGGPGAGKTEALKHVGDMPPQTLKLDNDKIKALLPEYNRMKGDDYAAYATHDEAAKILKQVLQEAIAKGVHVEIDGTGNDDPGQFEKRLKLFADNGYKVRVTLFDTPTDIGIWRTIDGAKNREDRWISPGYTRDTYEKVARVFLGWKGKGYISDWRMFSTLHPTPFLVAESQQIAVSQNGVKIHNPLFYHLFVQKAGGNHGR